MFTLRYRLLILFKNVKMSLLMKKAKLLTILIALIAVLSLASAVMPAFAEDVSSRNIYYYQGQGFDLQSVSDSNGIVGVNYRGLYFGGSGIEVNVRIYSDEAITIDFPINQVTENLTVTQQSTQNYLINLATEINKYINGIDGFANTQYDGTDGTPLSDIYRYNQAKCGETVEISEPIYNMLNTARQMYIATNGAFNPAVYRLVDLWGFSSRTYRRNGNLPYDRVWDNKTYGYPLPDEKYVKAFSNPSFTDFSEDAVKLSSSDGKFYVTKNVQAAQVDGETFEQWLDLGGIAKGYVADGIREMFKQRGLTRFYVDAGSSSQTYGLNYDGGDYVLLTYDPYKKDFLYQPTVVGAHLLNATVSSSGQYERKYTTDGVQYSHIVDGSLGKPAQTGVNSITIIAPQNYSATMGDCLTTALTVMGRDRVVDFMNGYLKDNGIKVLLTYETVDGGKQLLSNYDKSEVVKGDTFDEYAWSVKVDDNGNFVYDASAKAPVKSQSYTGWIIALSVVLALLVVAVIVVHIVKGRKKTANNVINAKRDKPFKIGDVGIYLAVVLLIVVLFAVIFGAETEQIRAVQVVDFSNSDEGELLFAYNVARNEWVVYSENSSGWNIEVSEDGNDINVKFYRTKDGKEQYNVMTITRGVEVSVKMTDATCSDKDCVYNFPPLTVADRAIVCSPSRIKVISQ